MGFGWRGAGGRRQGTLWPQRACHCLKSGQLPTLGNSNVKCTIFSGRYARGKSIARPRLAAWLPACLHSSPACPPPPPFLHFFLYFWSNQKRQLSIRIGCNLQADQRGVYVMFFIAYTPRVLIELWNSQAWRMRNIWLRIRLVYWFNVMQIGDHHISYTHSKDNFQHFIFAGELLDIMRLIGPASTVSEYFCIYGISR